MNLDNNMPSEVVSSYEGEDDMASTFRATYTYTEAQGIPHTIRLSSSSDFSVSAADLIGHKDTRMMSRVYAPTRHESIIAHQNLNNFLVENQLVVPA